MLVYRKLCLGLPLLIRCVGSSIPAAVLPALFSASIALCLEVFGDSAILDNIFVHPYPFQVFAYILAFALVFRTNTAHGRYWEARTSIGQMTSKWGDAAAFALSFDLAGAAPDDAFQARLVHQFSLMHALALQYLRRDNELANLCDDAGRARSSSDAEETEGLLPVPPAPQNCSRELCGDQDEPEAHARHLASVPLPVLGGVAPTTAAVLERYDDRVSHAFTAVLSSVAARRGAGGLAAAEAPVFSRVHHALSDGMLGFQQARKVEDTPFPFPYAQLLSFMLWGFMLLFPLLAASKTGSSDDISVYMGPLLTLLVVLSYFAMHEVARSLEDPFAHPPNDLPCRLLQDSFNARLIAAWDSALQAQEPLTDSKGGGRDSGGGFGCGGLELQVTRLRARRALRQESACSALVSNSSSDGGGNCGAGWGGAEGARGAHSAGGFCADGEAAAVSAAATAVGRSASSVSSHDRMPSPLSTSSMRRGMGSPDTRQPRDSRPNKFYEHSSPAPSFRRTAAANEGSPARPRLSHQLSQGAPLL